MLRRKIFGDSAIELTDAEESAARRAAQRAARESRRSLRTARGQYRRYRSTTGQTYLDWPRWRAEYRAEYRSGGRWPGGSPDYTRTRGDDMV